MASKSGPLGLSFTGLLGTVLFVILAYDIINKWQGAQAIEGTTFSGGTSMIKALQGR